MSKTVAQHRQDAPVRIRCAVVTVSDTRTTETDLGGRRVAELLEVAGHDVAGRSIVADEPDLLTADLQASVVREDVDAILVTGGTGISRRDQTFETVEALFTKPLPGYGELFRFLSFEQIGAAAMLSRATGGVIATTVVLTMPGSPAAVELAMEKLILPEIAHLVREAQR